MTGPKGRNDEAGAETPEEAPARLRSILEKLGPTWDEARIESIPLDEDLVEEAATTLRSLDDPGASGGPTGGWPRFLLPICGVFLIGVGVVLMGMNLLDATLGSLVVAGGFLLIVLAALGRGKRVEETKRRRRAEEILLLYGLEPPVSREEFLQQVELVRRARQALERTRAAR